MKEVLLRKLIEKKYFTPGTELDAKYKGKGLHGVVSQLFEQTFTVLRLVETVKGRLIIKAASNVDGQQIDLNVESIINIDGMTPERFAENFMIDEDGNDIKPAGKRRGRRPKGWVEEDMADAA